MTAKQKANRERFKKVVAEAKKLRKKNPKLTQAQAVKQAWAIQISKEKKNPVNRVKKYIQEAKEGIRRGYYGSDYKKKGKKVGAVKKKAAPKKSSSYHKDTKSHNVNIRVISGMNVAKTDILKKIQNSLQFVELYQDKINFWKQVQPKNKAEKDLKLNELKGWNKLLKFEEENISKLKRQF